MPRTYTGWNGNATGKLPGTERFVAMLLFLYGGKLKNLGTWNVRNIHGSTKPSVHGTGRAADIGYNSRETAHHLLDFLTKPEVVDTLQIERIHDYAFEGGPHGRGWHCEKNAWIVYKKPSIGSPGAQWVHVELAPTIANDANAVDMAFGRIFAPK